MQLSSIWPGVMTGSGALGAGFTVRGRIFDKDGRPASGASVTLVPGDGAAVITDQDRIPADDQGRFSFAGLAGGRVRLQVDHRGHVGWLDWVEPSTTELRIDLERAPVLRGQVLDARSGLPIPSYRIGIVNDVLSMTTNWSDDEGRFIVDTLEAGRYTLTIDASGYEQARLPDVSPSYGETELEIRLRPEG